MNAAAAQLDQSGIAQCETWLALHLDQVQRRFGAVGVGVIDLPPLSASSLIPGQIRVGAVLYWAREVERAGLLPLVEALADGVVRGTVGEPFGAAVEPLLQFWRSREHRFTGPERRAIYERALGSDQDDPVEIGLRGLVEILCEIGRLPAPQSVAHLEARAAVAAQDLGALVTTRNAGMAAFAARDIVGQVRFAQTFLSRPDVAHLLGGGGPMEIVHRHALRWLGREVAPESSLTRGRAGAQVLGWIADNAPQIQRGNVRVPRGSDALRAAEAWRASSGGA